MLWSCLRALCSAASLMGPHAHLIQQALYGAVEEQHHVVELPQSTVQCSISDGALEPGPLSQQQHPDAGLALLHEPHAVLRMHRLAGVCLQAQPLPSQMCQTYPALCTAYCKPKEGDTEGKCKQAARIDRMSCSIIM